MGASIPQIKKAASNIADYYGITGADSLRVVAFFRGDASIIRAILAGDFSAVPGAAASVGVVLGDNKSGSGALQDTSPAASAASVPGDGVNTSEKITAKRSRAAASPDRVKASKKDHAINYHADNKTAQYKPVTASNTGAASPDVIQGDIIPTVCGDIIPADDMSDALPLGFSETVAGWLHDYAAQYNIDLEKCASIQWRALCLSIGEKIQASGILRDKTREKQHGGKIYNPAAVAALVPIWEKITALYKHLPLAVDFVAFSGVSRQWFNDYQGRGLTSSSVQIAKRVHDIESAALSVALTDSRENPTGRIYYTKARLGWREVSEIVHTSAKETHAGGALPVFGDNGDLLPQNAV